MKTLQLERTICMDSAVNPNHIDWYRRKGRRTDTELRIVLHMLAGDALSIGRNN